MKNKNILFICSFSLKAFSNENNRKPQRMQNLQIKLSCTSDHIQQKYVTINNQLSLYTIKILKPATLITKSTTHIISYQMKNTTLRSIHVSSETHQTQIQILDSSIQSLINSWQRRQRWLLLFNTSNQQAVLNRAPWRTHLANFLDSTWVHIFSILLLIVDLIITNLELSTSLVSCDYSNMNTILELGFHWIGIGILILLSAKAMAQLVGLGFCSFFRHPGYVVDGVVAIGALVLETFLERHGGGLLAVVSLWRVIKVVESALELSDEAIEAQIAGIVCQFEALKEENRRLLEIIHEKEETIKRLKKDLDKCRH